MPLRKFYNAPTLQLLCLDNIATNMNNLWCADFKEKFKDQKVIFVVGPFNDLNSYLLQSLLRILTEEKKRMSKLYLQLLITPVLLDLDFSKSIYNKLVNDNIMDLVLARISRPRTLNLENCKKISSAKLVEVIEKYGVSLRKLVLTNTKYDDEVLTAIGENCKQLIHLEIAQHDVKISRTIESIFVNNKGRTDTAKSLKVLLMPGLYFDNITLFIANLFLHWCPQLLRFEHESIWEGLAKLCKMNSGPRQLNLVGSNSDYTMRLNDPFFKENALDINSVIQCVPNWKHLLLDCCNIPTGTELVLMLKVVGNSLITLSLPWNLPVDLLFYIGIVCPNLKHITIQLVTRPYGYYNNEEVKVAFEQLVNMKTLADRTSNKPWSNLCQLTMEFFTHEAAVSSEVVPVLKRICDNSSGSLNMLWINGYSLPDINDFFLWGLEAGCFKFLRYVFLNSTEIVPSTIWRWLNSYDHLCELIMVQCPHIYFQCYIDFRNYIEINDLNLLISDDYDPNLQIRV